MAKANRRSFLRKAPAAAVAVAAAASTAEAGEKKPVKKVHWNEGKRPDKPPLFSPAVSYGNLLFISGIGALSLIHI